MGNYLLLFTRITILNTGDIAVKSSLAYPYYRSNLLSSQTSLSLTLPCVRDKSCPHGQQAARLLCPWDFPSKNTGVGCDFLLQGIFLTQGSMQGLLNLLHWFSSVQSFSCVQHFPTPWTAAGQASLSITSFRSLLKLMSIELVMPSNHLILCHPLLLPSIFPNIRVFSNESVLLIRWPKYWSFSFSIGPSNVYSGLISFRMDWLDLLAVQGTLKSLLQHHSSKASILRCSAFFMV